MIQKCEQCQRIYLKPPVNLKKEEVDYCIDGCGALKPLITIDTQPRPVQPRDVLSQLNPVLLAIENNTANPNIVHSLLRDTYTTIATQMPYLTTDQQNRLFSFGETAIIWLTRHPWDQSITAPLPAVFTLNSKCKTVSAINNRISSHSGNEDFEEFYSYQNYQLHFLLRGLGQKSDPNYLRIDSPLARLEIGIRLLEAGSPAELKLGALKYYNSDYDPPYTSVEIKDIIETLVHYQTTHPKMTTKEPLKQLKAIKSIIENNQDYELLLNLLAGQVDIMNKLFS